MSVMNKIVLVITINDTHANIVRNALY